MDDLKGFVPFFLLEFSRTRKEIDVEANPSHLSSQEVQKTADACCHERRRCRFRTKKKVIDVQPSTVLNEKELVADASKHCSHAAPPCSAESRTKLAHFVMVELASVLEQEKPPFVFADAESFVCFADVYRQTASFG